MAKFNIISLLIVLIGVVAGNPAIYTALGGSTGVGKSYIATMLGCPSISCDGQDSCTMVTKVCSNDLVDMVGTDDNKGERTVTTTSGAEAKISGLTFPIYDFLDKIEANKISKVTFYHVFDVNNIRSGHSGDTYANFVTDTLKCPLTRVLNKFRDDNAQHVAKKLPSDIIIRENQQSGVQLGGHVCEFRLQADWRDRLLRNDLAAVTFSINQEQCTELKKRRTELQKHNLDQSEEGHDHNDCRYWGETGGQYCRGINFFGACSDWEPYRGWKTDEGCIRNRNENNRLKDVRNQQLREWKQSVRNSLGDLERALAAGHCDVQN